MKNSKRIGRIVLTALGAIIICFSVRGLMDIPAYKNTLGSAVYLEEAVILPENEGKMVIIHGTPEMTAPAYDEELEITLDAIKAYRYNEEYKLISSEKNNNKYNWVSRGTKSISGEAMLGEFQLDETLIAGFPADGDYENFDEEELNANGYNTGYGNTAEGAKTDRLWVIVGGTHYYDVHEFSDSTDIAHAIRAANKEIAEERNGAKAYAYKVYTGAASEEVTVAGVQQGNKLVAHEKLGAVVNSGVLSKEKLVDGSAGSVLGGSIAFMVLGLVLVFLGLRKGKAGRK